jgi:hypothetical protein
MNKDGEKGTRPARVWPKLKPDAKHGGGDMTSLPDRRENCILDSVSRLITAREITSDRNISVTACDRLTGEFGDLPDKPRPAQSGSQLAAI